MMRFKKWAAWLAVGALVANLLMPLGAGAQSRDSEPRGSGPSYGDPDQPTPSGSAQARSTVFLETGTIAVAGQVLIVRIRVSLLRRIWGFHV